MLPGRLPTAVLAAVTLELMLATVAAAGTVSYQDGVFRYRAHPGQSNEVSFGFRPAKADGTPGRLSGLATSPVTAGPGCSAAPSDVGQSHDILCLVTGARLPRYRLSLTARPDRAMIAGDTPLRGVIYSGPGADTVDGSAWRIYGGKGEDTLTGMRVHGGPGNDLLYTSFLAEAGRRSVLRGGAGDDRLSLWPGPGWAYGGPGNDVLRVSRHPDMLVGGPGRDLILADGSADTVRVRHGGHDIIYCEERSNREDVYFVDRSDAVDPCRDARVLFDGRPRIVR